MSNLTAPPASIARAAQIAAILAVSRDRGPMWHHRLLNGLGVAALREASDAQIAAVARDLDGDAAGPV